MLEARLAEMHLAVDDARQDMQPRGVYGLAGKPLGDFADGDDAPVSHPDIGKPLARMIDEGPAFENEVEGFGQGSGSTPLRAHPRFNSFIAIGTPW